MTRYLRILSLYFQQIFQHRARVLMWFLVAFINPLVLLLFWQGALAPNQKLLGWDISSMRTYYLLLIIAQTGLIHHVETDVAYTDIKQGELMRELLKPFPYITLKALAETPARILQMSYAIITVSVIVLFLHIPLKMSNEPIIILQAIMISLSAFVLSFLFKMLLGLAAFWMTSIDSLIETDDVLIMSLSGLVLPLNLFPSWLSSIAQFTPFPYILYYPVASLIGIYRSSELWNIMLVQFCWIVFLFVAYLLVWNRGLKKYSGVGQ